MSGTLYIVGTPIGNLSDLSPRALETLAEVDVVACEDTRHSGKLLAHFGLKKKLVSYHEHNEAARTIEILEILKKGRSVALISDSGMPTISDPGYGLVSAAHEEAIEVAAVPGPTAFATAAAVSGLPTDSLFFGGFLPPKTKARRSRLKDLEALPATLVFYESPKRLAACLRDCESVFGDRQAVVVRELTKLHEEIISGTLSELAERFGGEPVKGEIVLLIDREQAEVVSGGSEDELLKVFSKLKAEGEDRKSALKKAAKTTGFTRSEAYRIIQRSQ